jgi:TolA-binding protein
MPDDSLKGRVTRQGEEAIGRLAQDLLENPIVTGALTRAFETRERAMRAQEVAMGALNLPSAGDLERLTRRVRSVSQRLESIEDGLDRVEGRLSRPGSDQRLEERLEKIEALLERLESERPAPQTAPRAKPARAPRAASKPAQAPRAASKPARAPRSASKPRPKRSGSATG